MEDVGMGLRKENVMYMDFSDTKNAFVYKETEDGYFVYSRCGGTYPYGAAIGHKTIDIAMTFEGACNAIRDHRERRAK